MTGLMTTPMGNARYTTSYSLLFHELVTKHASCRAIADLGTITRLSCYGRHGDDTFQGDLDSSNAPRGAEGQRAASPLVYITRGACSSVG